MYAVPSSFQGVFYIQSAELTLRCVKNVKDNISTCLFPKARPVQRLTVPSPNDHTLIGFLIRSAN